MESHRLHARERDNLVRGSQEPPCSSIVCLRTARATTKATAMLYRRIEFSVVQGIERHLWKWAATVSGHRLSGQGSTREEAIENAKKAIARTIQKQRSQRKQVGEDRDDH